MPSASSAAGAKTARVGAYHWLARIRLTLGRASAISFIEASASGNPSIQLR